jgi:AraC family transcriptional regulator of adaptative response/methylated-DNA-[protein]-cysteine methyltransferase
MKIAFGEILKHLEDPFFEASLLGKNAIKNVTFSIERFEETPENFHIIHWKQEDNTIVINYEFSETEIGHIIIASTPKGICHAGFVNKSREAAFEDLKRRFPTQQLVKKNDDYQQQAIHFCNGESQQKIHLHLKGTTFQIEIWEKLLRIPKGKLTTYALLKNDPKLARAIGTAVGDNPVSFIIPCHRVVRNDGSFNGYFWGTELKRQLLAWELQWG